MDLGLKDKVVLCMASAAGPTFQLSSDLAACGTRYHRSNASVFAASPVCTNSELM